MALNKTNLAWFLMAILLSCLQTGNASNQADPAFDFMPMVVTAEKRSQTLQEIPLSISVLTNEKYNFATIKEASFLIPNLYISGLSARRTSFPYIRGLGSGQGEPVVATYIDGVPQLTPNTTDLELLDVDRIEFVRGPQGALYGRNTLGGVIHVITKRPSDQKGYRASVDIGDFNKQRYTLGLTVPFGEEEHFLTMAASYAERDGYVKNNITRNTVDDRQTLFGRASLRLTGEDGWELIAGIFGERDRDGDFVLFDLERSRDNPYRIEHDFEGKTDRDVIAPSLSLTRRGIFTDFFSISGYEYFDATDLTDADFRMENAVRRKTDENQHQFYQEFRLQSSEEADVEVNDQLSLRWLTGISFFYSEFEHDAYTEFRQELPMLFPQIPQFLLPFRNLDEFELNDLGTNLFGQLTLTVYNRLDIQVGLGFEFEHRKADLDLLSNLPVIAQTQTEFDEDFSELLPKLGLTYRWSNELMIYSYAAKGFRAGGYNRNRSPSGNFQVDEEESWTYEAGMKSRWFEDRLTINLALFYIDWNDMQLDVPNLESPDLFFLDNAGKSESKGFEMEISAQVAKHWEFFAGFGYTDAEFKDYIDPVTAENVEGKSLPNVPEFTWNIGFQNRLEINGRYYIFVNAELVGIGKLFFNNVNTASQNDYALANFRAGVGGQRWRLEAWIRNAFDRHYVSLAFPVGTAFGQSGFVSRSGPPQTAGITLKFEM